MDNGQRELRQIVAAIEGYCDAAWRSHGVTRYIGVGIVFFAVLLVVPDWKWAAAAGVLSAIAVAVDVAVDRWMARRLISRKGLETADGANRVRRNLIGFVVWIVLCYAAPNVVLAFAPAPGPAIGLMFSLTGLILMASQHVMTRRMFWFTAPPMATAAILHAAMLSDGWTSLVFAVLAVTSVANAAKTAGAGANTFLELIDARLDAEDVAASLDRRVEERTAELHEAKAAAEAASETKSRFIANVSHEQRTPLNAIIGYSEIIEEDLAYGDARSCPDDIRRVQSAARHLLGLISDILDIAKVEADTIALKPDRIDTRSLAREVFDAVAPLAQKNRVRCVVDVQSDAEHLVADPLRVRQCLLNLMSNAAKFTADGDIVLGVCAVDWHGGAGIAFAVRDTGEGIDAALLGKLFTPFVQGDDSTTRRTGGAGLGLSITRRLARLMGGDVTVASVPGRGSTFTLVLPRAPAERDARLVAA
jgi:signal transduction histidine kinase